MVLIVVFLAPNPNPRKPT